MTIAMPRCSCGCGERLTDYDLGCVWLARASDLEANLQWVSENCLKRRRATLAKSKPKDGENEALRRGAGTSLRRKAKPGAKRGACDTCQKWRALRWMGPPDAQVALCKECVP